MREIRTSGSSRGKAEEALYLSLPTLPYLTDLPRGGGRYGFSGALSKVPISDFQGFHSFWMINAEVFYLRTRAQWLAWSP